MITVVVDTNILLANFSGHRPNNRMQLVFRDAKRGNFRLIVPELVLQEFVNKRRESASEASTRLRQSHATLATLGLADTAPSIDVGKLMERFESTFRALLGRRGCDVADLPDVAHSSLLSRALAREKPFKSSGAGYRDALLWHTVAELTGDTDDTVVFLTNNLADFAEDRSHPGLAEDLKRDLVASGIDANRVRLIPTLEEFADQHLAAETRMEGELEELLNGSTPLRRELEDRLEFALLGHVFDPDDIRDFDIDRLDLGYDVEDAEVAAAEVEHIDQLNEVTVIQAALLEEDRVLVEIEAELDAGLDLSLYVRVRRTLFEEVPPPRTWRGEGLATTLLIGAEATYRPSEKDFEDLNVFHVRP